MINNDDDTHYQGQEAKMSNDKQNLKYESLSKTVDLCEIIAHKKSTGLPTLRLKELVQLDVILLQLCIKL